MPKIYDIEQGLIIGLAIIFLVLANIAIISDNQVVAAELPRDGKIIVSNRALVMWDFPEDTVRVLGYRITAIGSIGQAAHYVDCQDTLRLCGIMDISGIVADSSVERVKFWVQAYNTAGYSAPSDTVDLPMAKNKFLFGDLNEDGKCNVKDSAILWRRGVIGSIKGMKNFDWRLDVDANGRIDVFDHIAFINNLGRSL
jgi:hypothetical protein